MSPQPPQPPAAGHTQPQASLYDENPYELLIQWKAATRHLLDAHERMMKHLDGLAEPAGLETVVLTPAAPTYESQISEHFASISILNPNAINIYFSGVGTAGATTRSPSAPPNCLVTLPIQGMFLEVAANPVDLGANNAVVFVLRHSTVQAAFLGKGA